MKTLIVEDEMITARDIAEIVTRLDHTVIGIANTCEKAINLIEKQAPDLALVDISLKGERDGVEFAQALRSQYRTSIVFITAHADTQTISRIKPLRPNGFIVKPFTFDSINAAIELAGLDTIASEIHDRSEGKSLEDITQAAGLPQPILNRVLDYIEKRFNRNLPISELAYMAKLSEDYFSTQFRKSLGTTPHQFIMQKRIDEAKHLLTRTELSVSRIAEMVGYQNENYFSTTFKRQVGVTPSQYRRQSV